MRQLSSDGVDGLLWLRQRCLGRAVNVVLRRPSRQSVDLLRRTGLLGMLTIEGATPAGATCCLVDAPGTP